MKISNCKNEEQDYTNIWYKDMIMKCQERLNKFN